MVKHKFRQKIEQLYKKQSFFSISLQLEKNVRAFHFYVKLLSMEQSREEIESVSII